MQLSSPGTAAYLRCRVRLALRDGTAVEGFVHAPPGQPLAEFLAACGAWVNVTGVRVDGGEDKEHAALQASSILWAAPVAGSLAVSVPVPSAAPRIVEAALETGVVIRGVLALRDGERLSDHLAAAPAFLPLLRARIAPGREILGDVVVNQAALLRLGEAAAGEPAPRAASAPAPPSPDVRPLPVAGSPGAPSDASRASGGEHWLAAAARRAGVLDGPVELAPGDPPWTAWTAVARAAGVAEARLAALAAGPCRLRAAVLEAAEPEALARVPEKLARRYGVLPLRLEGRHLVVAAADPGNLDLESALRFATGLQPVFELAGPGDIARALDRCYDGAPGLDALVSGIDAELARAVRVVEETRPEAVGAQEVEAAPVVRLTNQVLRDAVRQGASDVHIEPAAGAGTVRFRVDGVLRPYMQMPVNVLNRVVSRIKVLGAMDIADRLRPQDGRARLEIEGRSYDLRLSTVPTRDAEKAVVRILNPGDAQRLQDLSIPMRELAEVRRLLLQRSAIVLVSGPTGSGKTSTLYAGLREMATGELNIMSVEDPVEYELPGVTQIQVEPRRNVTFASALRAILRQDPDVIFVGEVRDRETAQIAVQASLTGHLVLATVHTNSAAGAVARLQDLGVDRASIASALGGVVAQRLVRRVCPECVRPVEGETTAEEERLAARFGARPAVRAAGCSHCAETGYRGRLPIVEVLPVTPEVERLVTEGAATSELEQSAAAAGMRTLLESALARVEAGETTLQEVERVLGEGASGGR